MKIKYRILFFCITCFVLIGCDRAAKDFAKVHLRGKEPLSYFHNTIRLEYAENTGAFLSFGAEWPTAISFWIFSVLPLLFLSGVFVYAISRVRKADFLEMLPYGLIFSGGIGNILDRILFDRHVVDFINIGFINLRTGIFNFADIYVTTGVLLLLLNAVRRRKPIDSSIN